MSAVAITEIAVGKLRLADDNLRTNVGDVGELAESMKSLGVLEPLLVTDDFLVVAGARRLEAAKKAGLKVVPTIVRPFTEEERLEVMIVENLQREGLTPLEEAEGFRRLVDLGMTQRTIANRVGRSQSHVAKRLSLLTLPEEVRAAVDSGGIKLESAQELATLKDDAAVATIAKQIISGNGDAEWASRQVSTKVKAVQEKAERAKKVKSAAAAFRKQGKTVVEIESDEYGYSLRAPEGYAFVKERTFNESEVEMAPGKHEKLKCHAVGVHPTSFNEVALCSKPSKHPSKAKEQKATRESEAQAAEKRAAERKAIAERRRTFLKTLVAGKVEKDAILNLLYVLLVEDTFGSGYQTNELTFELLGIGDVEAQAIASEFEETYDEECGVEDLLQVFAEKSAANRLRMTLACVLSQLEVGYRISPAYLAMLVGLGYELSKPEQEYVKEAAANEQARIDEAKAAREAEAAEPTEQDDELEDGLQQLADELDETLTVIDVSGDSDPVTVEPEPPADA